jgi:hypothetical protein
LNKLLRPALILLLFALIPSVVFAADDGASSSAAAGGGAEESVRLATIRYGTETEIASLIEALHSEGADYLDDELIKVAETTRNRNILKGVFTHHGHLSLKKAENQQDFLPIDEECGCKVCRTYSRAYLRHLFKTQEILISILASYHNLYFLHDLVMQARQAIEEDRFIAFKKQFLSRYGANGMDGGEGAS